MAIRRTAGAVLLAAAVLALTAATAQTGRIQSQPELNARAAADFTKADAELNRVYTKLVRALEEPQRTKLVKAERAWIAFRDAEADFEASEAEGGSMQPMLYNVTRADLTKKRTKELRAAYDQFGAE